MNLSKLTEPFKPSDIEWRVQSSGINTNGPWAMVLAYVTARAVQNRLDEVFGVMGWKDTYRHESGGVICTLSAYDASIGQWVEKENGSPETEIEAFKGGISKALVRVASSGFGVGRYLYDLDTAFVKHVDNGKRYDIIKDKKTKQKIGEIKWNEPSLPVWALPKGTPPQPNNDAAAKAKIAAKAAKGAASLKAGNIAGWIAAATGEIMKGRSAADYWKEYRQKIIDDCGEDGAKEVHAKVIK